MKATKEDSSVNVKGKGGRNKSTALLRGSVLITQLPSDLKEIYRGVIPRFFPAHSAPPRRVDRDPHASTFASTAGENNEASSSSASPSPPRGGPPALFESLDVIEEVDNATLLLEVKNKEAAAKLYKRLQNVRCCGRRWKVQYLPLSAVRSNPEPCLMQCTLVPPALPSTVESVLRSIPGFLALAHVTRASHAAGAARGEGSEGGEVLAESVLASFCAEGSALHARAVLSGRLIGSSGVRMFIQRWKDAESTS